MTDTEKLVALAKNYNDFYKNITNMIESTERSIKCTDEEIVKHCKAQGFPNPELLKKLR